MSKLLYRTIAGERPQGKPNVYFSCHPDDLKEYFEEYASKILKIQDCAIWYESEPDSDYDRVDLELNLSQMQLFVMPVTTRLLTTQNRAIEVELPLAKKKHISVLPLMMENGLVDLFAGHFGDLQYMDPDDRDETRIGFDERLTTYIRSVLVSNELAERVRAAFDAYIFLSYRKKDRKKAQELMRLIHKNPLCRDIAIWYDEFLTPGEDFNQAIGKMLKDSDLFAMVVTPNLVNEVNYVMTMEYPAAVEQEKLVFPVEMEKTDRRELEAHYEALPPCVPGEDGEEFRGALFEKIRELAVTGNDKDPEHCYLIGLAYLDGIDVEVDSARALELITGAAVAGVPEAIEQLVTMYETGKGVARDYREGIRWREKYTAKMRTAYEAKTTEKSALKLYDALWGLGDAQYALKMLDAAEKIYDEMRVLADRLVEDGKSRNRRYLSITFGKLGDIAQDRGDLTGAQDYYEKGFVIDEELAKETGTIESREDLSIMYGKLGEIAKLREDLSKAQKYYEDGLAINEKLAEEARTLQARRNLAFYYEKLGTIASSRGNYEEAQKYYEKCLDISEKLAEETGAIAFRRDLAITFVMLGGIAIRQGDLSGAKRFFEKGLAIQEELEKETGTIWARRELSLNYGFLGETVMMKGDLEEAQKCYERQLFINEKLAEEAKTYESKRDLSRSYYHLGQISSEKGDLEGAQRYFEKTLVGLEQILEKEEIIYLREFQADVYMELGCVSEKRGDLAGAQRYFEINLAIYKELAEKTETISSKISLAGSNNNLGDVAKQRGDLAEAQRYFEISLTLYKELAVKTETIALKIGLAGCYVGLGDVAMERGDLLGAQKYYEISLAIFKELAEKTGAIDLKRYLSTVYSKLRDVAKERGDLEEAQNYYAKSNAIDEELA